MVHRADSPEQLCAVCGARTDDACRRCGAPLCGEHAVRFEFFVPTVECREAGPCKPFTAQQVDTWRRPLTMKFAGIDVPFTRTGSYVKK